MDLITAISPAIKSYGQSPGLLFLAASLPPVFYLLLKKKKPGLFQHLLTKFILKRKMRKKKAGRFGLKDVFGILSLLCLIAGLVLATSGGQGELARILLLATLAFLLAWAIAARYS